MVPQMAYHLFDHCHSMQGVCLCVVRSLNDEILVLGGGCLS
jgi:hypothetical protein